MQVAMPDSPEGNVTTVRIFVNMTSEQVAVISWQNRKDDLNVAVNSAAVSHPDGGAMQVPWCDSKDSWGTRHIDIEASDGLDTSIRYSIWQSGPILRYSTDHEWHADGDAVPGDAGIGTEKIIIVGKDLNLNSVNLSG
jgi:hypothetical protein